MSRNVGNACKPITARGLAERPVAWLRCSGQSIVAVPGQTGSRCRPAAGAPCLAPATRGPLGPTAGPENRRPDGPEAGHALTVKPDHPVGAGPGITTKLLSERLAGYAASSNFSFTTDLLA